MMFVTLALGILLSSEPLDLIKLSSPSSFTTELSKYPYIDVHSNLISSDGKTCTLPISDSLSCNVYRLPEGAHVRELDGVGFVRTSATGPVYLMGSGDQLYRTADLTHKFGLYAEQVAGFPNASRFLIVGVEPTHEAVWAGDVLTTRKLASENPFWGPIPTDYPDPVAATLLGDTWRLLINMAPGYSPRTLEYRLDPRRRTPRRIRAIGAVPNFGGLDAISLNAEDDIVTAVNPNETWVFGDGAPRHFPTPAGKVSAVFGTRRTCVWQLESGDGSHYDLAVRDEEGTMTTRASERIVAASPNGTILMIHRLTDDSFWLAKLR